MRVGRFLRFGLPLLIGLSLLAAGCSSRPGGWFSSATVMADFRLPPPTDALHQPVALAAFTSDELYGRISPDGYYLVYASNQKGNLDIWLRDLTTGMPERLTQHVAVDTQPAFSPDGETIAFVSMRDDVKGDIYLRPLGSDKLTRLTDRATEDAFPIFHPDGESLLFASGPEGKPRIVRMWIKDRRTEPLTDYDATQPALSPDGRLLAYVQRDDARISRLMLKDLETGRTRAVTTQAYQCGFPTFSPDGNNLYFTRFYYTQPGRGLEGHESGVIFRSDLGRLGALSPQNAEDALEQISSGRRTHLFLAAHPEGLVYTTRQDGTLDVLMMPFEGLYPAFDTPAAQLDFALSLDNDLDRLLAFRKLRRFPDSQELQHAYYLASRIDHDLKWYDKQQANLASLDDISRPIGDWQGMARVDLAVWDTVSTAGLTTETGVRLVPRQINEATARLQTVQDRYRENRRVLAYALLREGDLLELSGRNLDAIAAYEAVWTRYPEQRDITVQARVKLAYLFALMNDADLQIGYYLAIFTDYPDDEARQRTAAKRIIAVARKGLEQTPEIEALANPPEFDDQRRRIPEAVRETRRAEGRRLTDRLLVDHLRRLIEANPEFTLLGAIFQYQIGRIYHRLGDLDLAIRAMERVVTRYPTHPYDLTRATFALGEYSLEQSHALRAAGRFNEAGRTYSQALGYYERITRMYPPTHENHRRARREFLSLGLLKAGQNELDGDIDQAIADYQRLADFDPNVIQAHRKLIYYAVKQGRAKDAETRYKAMARENPSSFVAHYALGYLATWRENLSGGDLEDAETHLRRALGLNSQSPYAYLTLGWVYEMRELYLKDVAKGWLEEAIRLYDQAWRVNDRGADIQVEADILLNLGNAFVHLGNTWRYAYDMYQQRTALSLPFLDPVQDAIFCLNFGRAAFNLNHYDEASAHFDRALQLARRTQNPTLQAEAIARQALTLHMQGEYDLSTQFFERSIATYRQLGQMTALAALVRSIALNHFHLGQRDQAMARLKESLELLDTHGTRDTGDFTRLALAPAMSLWPRGFDRPRERAVNRDLRHLILSDMQLFATAGNHLDYTVDFLDRLLAEAGGEDVEIMREQVIVANRQGRLALGLGDDTRAVRELDRAYRIGEYIQSVVREPDDPDFETADDATRDLLISETRGEDYKLVVSLPEFEAQLINATAAAEVLLRRDARGETVRPEDVAASRVRLARIMGRLERERGEAAEAPVRRDLFWRLQTDFALVSLNLARRPLASDASPSDEPEEAWGRFLSEARLYADAVLYLKRVLADTQALMDLVQADPATVLPVSPPSQLLRIHVETLLNLAEVASYFASPDAPSDPQGPSLRFLARAKTLCDQWRLDDLCWLADMAKAQHTQDPELAKTAAAAFLAFPPAALPPAYLQNADGIRQRMLTTGAEVLLRADDPAGAWGMLEQESRRLVVDELARLSHAVDSPELRDQLAAMRAAQDQYRNLAASQSPADPEPVRTERRTKLAALADTILTNGAKIQQVAPRLHGLLAVTPFTPDLALSALEEHDAALSVVPLGNQVHTFLLTPKGVHHAVLAESLDSIRESLDAYQVRVTTEEPPSALSLKIVGDRLLHPLRAHLADVTTLYVDGDRLDPDLRWSGLVRTALKSSPSVLRIASLRGLADSFAARNIFVDAGQFTVSEPAPGEAPYRERLAQSATERPGWRLVASPDLVYSPARDVFTESGITVFDQPLRFEGKSAANAWMRFDTDLEGFGHFAFAEHLDSLWRANLIVFAQTSHTRRVRAERLCLERLMTAFGVPGFATRTADWPRDEETARAWIALTETAARATRREAIDAGLAVLSPERAHASADHLLLWGHKGMDAAAARRFAESSLMPTLTQAANLQRSGAPRAAVEQYELTLRLMRYLDNTQYLDKVLEMLVAQSAVIQDWDRAIRYQLQVLSRAQGISDAAPEDLGKLVAVIKAKETLSSHYAKARRFDEALATNQEIIDALIANKREPLTAVYRGQRGIFLEFAARYPEALDQYLATLALHTQANNLAGRIEQSTNTARILRLHLSRYREARHYIETALSLAQGADLGQQVRLKLELARVNFAMGSFQRAADISRQIIDQARPVVSDVLVKGRAIAQNAALTADQKKEQLAPLFSLKTQMDSAISQAHLELVNALYRLGAYTQALAVYDTGMELARAQNDRLRQIQFTNIKGLVYTQMGDTARAVEAFDWMREQAEAIHSPYEQANALSNLGETYRKAGEFAKARQMFSRAMQIDRLQNSRLGLAFDNANLGLTFENMGRDDDAISHFTTALTISREIDSPINEAKSLLGLGRIALKQKQLDAARTHLEQGLALVERLNMTDWLWRFHLQYGRLLLRQKNPKAALDDFLAGISIVEAMPASVRQRDDAPKIEESRLELYDEAIDLLASEGRAEEAFAFSERFRARHFLDLVGAARPTNAGAAALFEAEASLANELRSADDAMKKATENERASLRERLDSLRGEYDQTIRKLAALSTELPSYVTVQTADIATLRAALPAATPLVSYYPTPRRLVLFALDADGLRMLTVPVTRKDLFEAVRTYRRLVTRFHPVDDTANTLYKWLLAPLSDWLAGRDQLLVVPFGALHALPFAALHDGSDYLVSRLRVGYLSSVNQLVFLPVSATKPPSAPLGIGGPFVRPGSDPMGELPFTAHELRALKERFPAARLMENAAATPQAYAALAPTQHWLHIATHAEYDPTNPFASYLALAPSEGRDGALRLADILSVPLSADLVSLSACDTALGPLSEGDGQVSLSRAFLAAGAKRVLASLWRVSDLSTAVLMKHWFREMGHQEPSPALQHAQNQVRKQFPHPAYWAGFRMEGLP